MNPVQGPSRSVATGRATVVPTGVPWWVVVIGFLGFVAGYAAATAYISNVSVANEISTVDFDLWVAVLGALAGWSVAILVLASIWLTRLARLFTRLRPRAVWGWVLGVAAIDIVLAVFLYAGAATAADEQRLDIRLTRETQPLSLAIGLCMVPALVTFLALRSLARDDENWQEPGSGRMLLVIRSRAELRRLTTVLGVLLTLLVVATGLRRRALLAYDPGLPIPAAQVLLYGLLFAVLLGLMYLASTSAIDRRAALFLDEFAPLPDPGAGDLGTPLARRNDLGAVIGAGGSWRSFETTVVIVAPLLTALIGIATGN